MSDPQYGFMVSMISYLQKKKNTTLYSHVLKWYPQCNVGYLSDKAVEMMKANINLWKHF